MSKYPRDEFDKVPETSSRQGVHRERLIPSRSTGLGWIITVGVLALVLGLAAYFVLPRLGIGQDGGPAPAAVESSAATQSPEPTPEPTESAEEAGPAEPTQPATPTPEPSPPVTADLSLPVAVLNGSGVSGLGASISMRLSAEGWTTAQVANWAGQPVQSSIIFYNGPQQLANAEALSALLGIPTLVEDPSGSYVTVVAGPGFQ